MAGIGPPPPPREEHDWLKAAKEQEAKRFAKRKRPGEEQDSDEDEPGPKIQRSETPFDRRKEAFFQQLKTLPLGDIFDTGAQGTVASAMLALAEADDLLWRFAVVAVDFPGRDRVLEVILQGAAAHIDEIGSRASLVFGGLNFIYHDFATAHPLQTKLIRTYLTREDLTNIITAKQQAEAKVREAFANEVEAKLRDRTLRLRDSAVYEIKTYDPLGRFASVPEERKDRIILPRVFRAYQNRRKREDADLRRRREPDAKRTAAAELLDEEAQQIQQDLTQMSSWALHRYNEREDSRKGYLEHSKLQMMNTAEFHELVKEEIERRAEED